MNIGDEFKRALVRRLAYVLVFAALAWIGIGKAQAQTCGYGQGCTIEQAYTACRTFIDNRDKGFWPYVAKDCVGATNTPSGSFTGEYCRNGACGVGQYDNRIFYFSTGCPASTEWFSSLQKCDKPCSQRNADLGGANKPDRTAGWGQGSGDQCISECKYRLVSDQRTETAIFSIGGASPAQHTQIWGQWEYTGDRCPPSQPQKPRDDEKPKESCTPAESGQTYCSKPNGDSCHTASTGRTICWKSNENGTKTDGPITQTKSPGDQPPASIDGSTHTGKTTVTNTTNNSSSSTTFNNYTTNNGAPAGSSNQGGPANPDGSSSGSPGGSPGGEENGNESAGGVNCESTPTSSGDPILGNILVQTWNTRCEIVKSRGKMEGSPQCNQGGVVGFSCTGDQALCFNALKAQEASCKAEYEKQVNEQQAADIAAEGDGLDGIEVSDIYGDSGADYSQINENLLGGSAGQCSFGVDLSILGEPIEIPPAFWELAQWIGLLVIAGAYLWVAQQLGS